jgi:hypothetical protein
MFSKFWSSKQHECKECHGKTIKNRKGKGSTNEGKKRKQNC